MASMTRTSPKPLVPTYLKTLEVKADKRRVAETAEKQRQADARVAAIRSNSELLSHLSRTPIEAVNLSSSSPPRRHEQDVAEIDGRAVSTSPSHHSNVDLPLTPAQSSSISLSDASSPRVQTLESQLASQDARIHELEAAHADLTRRVVELQTQRDEAEQALLEATIAGTEAREEREKREETVAVLRQQITGLIEDRKMAEREIEELKSTERGLRRELDEERDRVRRLEAEIRPLERSDATVAAPAVAASIVGASSRRESVGESERRRHGHGRRHSSGSSINIGLKLKWGDDKERKKKGGRK